MIGAPYIHRDTAFLALSIAIAFFSRFFVLLVGRPDFVGWFNHSAYYWVQSRSLIEHGELAYGDMPLLFAVYAGLSQVMNMAGMPLESAIILASRLVMITTPALIPISIYLLAKHAVGWNKLSWPMVCLVFASGFLPLTFANMPEHLQKNMLGLLLLAFSLLALFHWLQRKRIRHLVVFSILLVMICLTHLGSALAALLLVGAMAIDILLRRVSLTSLGVIALLSIAMLIGIGIGIQQFDPATYERVVALLAGLIPEGTSGVLVFLLIIAAWFTVLWALWRWFARQTTQKSVALAALGRIIIVWLGLLAMPLWPGDISMRLILFIPLGAVVLLVILVSFFSKDRSFRYVTAAAALIFTLMSIGEATSLFMTYPNKAQTSSQLAAVADEYRLTENDLVITPYGVNSIANWFLGTKGALLTAVEQNALEHYDRVFVLNTLERRAPTLRPAECRLIQSEYDRYWTTRHDIPLDGATRPDGDYDLFAFYELLKLPDHWQFDNEGLWTGWGDC